MLLVVVLVVARPWGPVNDSVVVAGPSATVPEPQLTFGDVSGVTLAVTPAAGLVDGQSVTVRVDGLDQIPGAQLAMCRGDLEEPVGLEQCDLGAVGPAVAATEAQRVTVSASLTLAGRATPFDCATEPAGCVLAVGALAPSVRGVAVPLDFLPGTAPVQGDESLTVSPLTGLSPGQSVAVAASGLDPGRSYRVVQCAPALDDPSLCLFDDEAGGGSVTADAGGLLSTDVAVSPVVWSAWDGVVDCTVRDCHLLLVDDYFSSLLRSPPLGFARGVVPELPLLALEPGGPYVDGQEVVVRGSGFTPGTRVAGRVGQCPGDLDTRKEERCAYTDIGSGDVVAADGTFVTKVVLRESLLFAGSCRAGAACVVGWVINHGPTVAAVPVSFR